MKDLTQIQFFRQIKEHLPVQFSMAEEIADLLEISTDSVYRRIRGETALSFDEIKKLCTHFKVPLDFLTGNSTDAVTFSYKMINENEPFSFEKYLDGILNDMVLINKFEKKEIFYAAEDVPLFHHFQFPELTAFKIFFWLKSIIGLPKYDDASFHLGMLNDELIKKCSDIYTLYIKIPSIEIWTDETLNSTLRQIQYSWESGYFENKSEALLICDQVAQMMAHISKQAEFSFKTRYMNDVAAENTETFKMYYSEVMIGNNNILVTCGDTQTTYLTHNTLNYLITRSESFCRETDSWLKNMVKKSIPISGVSEKHRNLFFRKASENILSLRQKIESGN